MRRAGKGVWVDGTPAPEALCPLCERPIPVGAKASRHHLVPKLKGGSRLGTVLLHQICHSTIHALFSEAELARRLHDVEALRADPALQPFLAWIADKPPFFHARTAPSGGTRRDRRGASRR